MSPCVFLEQYLPKQILTSVLCFALGILKEYVSYEGLWKRLRLRGTYQETHPFRSAFVAKDAVFQFWQYLLNQ